MPVDISFLF